MSECEMLFEEEEPERDYNHRNGNQLSQRDRFPQKSYGQHDSKKWRTGEDDLTSGGANSLCRGYVEDKANSIGENTHANSHCRKRY